MRSNELIKDINAEVIIIDYIEKKGYWTNIWDDRNTLLRLKVKNKSHNER